VPLAPSKPLKRLFVVRLRRTGNGCQAVVLVAEATVGGSGKAKYKILNYEEHKGL
jgi:hypothetical protein